MAYAALTDLRAYLKLATGDTGDDTLLTALLARAQAAIDAYCMRTFEASTNTSKYLDAVADVQGRTLLIPRSLDLCSINTITNGDGTTVSSDDYVTEPRNAGPYWGITLKASSGLSWTYTDDPENAITISGKWAYSASAPADVVQATIRLAAYMYRQKDAGTYDVTAFPEAGVMTIPQGVPRDVLRLLAPYVRRT